MLARGNCRKPGNGDWRACSGAASCATASPAFVLEGAARGVCELFRRGRALEVHSFAAEAVGDCGSVHEHGVPRYSAEYPRAGDGVATRIARDSCAERT